MWSFNGSENYNVRYAVADKITGPYREINRSMTVPILQRDDAIGFWVPDIIRCSVTEGVRLLLIIGNIIPFVDSKRQTCIDEVFFNEDGSIRPITPTHKGGNGCSRCSGRSSYESCFRKADLDLFGEGV